MCRLAAQLRHRVPLILDVDGSVFARRNGVLRHLLREPIPFRKLYGELRVRRQMHRANLDRLWLHLDFKVVFHSDCTAAK